MEHIEIERRFLPLTLPDGLEHYPHEEFLQGYLSTPPTVRVRRGGEAYVLIYKGSGLLKREEYNLSSTAESLAHPLEKCDGLRIRKTRYLIPLPGIAYTAESDRFQGEFAGLSFVEVESPDEVNARAFTPPAWFGREVIGNPCYRNSLFGRFGLPGKEKA